MRIRRVMLIAAVVLAACDSETITGAPGDAQRMEAGVQGLKVMSYNVYYGADFTPLLAAPLEQVPFVAAQAWAAAQQSNIPARAGRIAALIADNRPDLVGLQEAAIYRVQHPGDAIIGGTVPATDVVYDFLALIVDSLAARGLEYDVVAADSTTDIELPVFTGLNGGTPTFDDVRLTDRDAILARHDLAVSDPEHGAYGAHIPVSLGPMETGVYEGWSSAKVAVRGVVYRFIATHLEFQQALPVQIGQAQELLALLDDDDGPTIVAGDFNSDAYGQAPDAATPSYGMMLDAGFLDTWAAPQRNAPGLTCCQAADLLNEASALDTRVDFVFARNLPGAVSPFGILTTDRKVVGDDDEWRTADGLWPSDHAAVVTAFRAPATTLP
ncbi:MAG: endonuclease/exonuclease/phosphatase family protein [Gemmatimonadota bacterium]